MERTKYAPEFKSVTPYHFNPQLSPFFTEWPLSFLSSIHPIGGCRYITPARVNAPRLQSRINCGQRCGLGRHHGEQHQVHRSGFGASGQGKQGVAIECGVGRANAAGQAVVGAHGQAFGLGFGEGGVGGHHTNGGVGAGQRAAAALARK